jgi:hypothetical protein
LHVRRVGVQVAREECEFAFWLADALALREAESRHEQKPSREAESRAA